MRDKQINDLAEEIREIKEYITDIDGTTYGERYVTVSHSKRIAKYLLDAGYRKASEVAREIIRILRAAGINKHRYPVIAEIEKIYLGEDINAPTKESEGEG